MIPSPDEAPPSPKKERRSVEALIAYYWHADGGGYRRALAEARRVLEAGGDLRDAAENIGWRPSRLRDALDLGAREKVETDEDRAA